MVVQRDDRSDDGSWSASLLFFSFIFISFFLTFVKIRAYNLSWDVGKREIWINVTVQQSAFN